MKTKHLFPQHVAIAEFPSNHFYNGKLKPGLAIQSEPSPLKIMWTGSSGKHEPIRFCHVIGKEEVLTVASSEGNEQSRKNEIEVEQAVSIKCIPVQVICTSCKILFSSRPHKMSRRSPVSGIEGVV
jgi:hypothetical protein